MKKGSQTEVIPIHNKELHKRFSERNIKKDWAKIALPSSKYMSNFFFLIYYFFGGTMKKELIVYPAIFTKYTDEGEYYIVDFIDLKDCLTEGNTLQEAFYMAQDAMGLYLEEMTKAEYPEVTTNFSSIKLKENQFISFVNIDMNDYRQKVNSKAMNKTVTLPVWLNNISEKNNINFSQVLQRALKEELKID